MDGDDRGSGCSLIFWLLLLGGAYVAYRVYKKRHEQFPPIVVSPATPLPEGASFTGM